MNLPSEIRIVSRKRYNRILSLDPLNTWTSCLLEEFQALALLEI